MITSAIGRIFLNAYNEKFGTSYDARTFFIEQFYPLFFDAEKYMKYATNSPFVQGLPNFNKALLGKDNVKFESLEKRGQRLKEFLDKSSKGTIDASIAIGYPSSDETQTTSGQVSDMQLPLTQDDIFLSWIGDGLGVGVGDLTILFSKKEILLDIFEGWKLYRKILNENKILKGNQINTWNGQWLSHFYNNRAFSPQKPLANFAPFSKPSSDGIISLETQRWTQVLVAIAKKFPDIKIVGYIYSIGQMNTTIGFIPFDLSQVRGLIDLYEKFFGLDSGQKAEPLWGTAFGFKKACANGCIGTKSMEPKGLREFISGGKLPKEAKDEETKIKFNTYQIWLLAMLNNEELWEKSQELAELLNEASVDKKKSSSTKNKNLVENLIASINKKQFIDAATELLPIIDNSDDFIEMVKEVHCMPNDNVPYFLTLLRFRYKSLNNR